MVLTLIQQILVMLAMMAVGVALVRLKALDDAGVKQLSTIAMYVATPAVIVQSFAITYNAEQLVNALWMGLFYTIALVLSAAIGVVLCGKADRIGRFAVILSNSGFVGIPIIAGLLGQEYVFYVTITMAVSTFFVWTYGVLLISGDKGQVSARKILTNPAVIALAIGLVLFFAPVSLPGIVSQFLSGMANLNTGLAMIVLGANLGTSNLGLLASDRRLYKAIAVRLLVVPAVLVPVLMLMPASFEVRMVLFIVEACPAGALTSMFAQIFGGDYQYATGVVVGSTLLSMATMPIVLMLALAVL